MPRLLNRTGWVAAGVLTLLLVAALAGVIHAGSLDPPAGPPAPTRETPITSLPATISANGSYILTGNLTGAPGSNGITIAASATDVSLDLRGFTLAGPGGAGTETGILAANQGRLAIRNGSIVNWGGGGLTSSRNGNFENLRFDGDAHNAGVAVFVSNSVLSNCTVTASGRASAFTASAQYSTVTNCSFAFNAGMGLYLAYSTGTGIQGTGNASGDIVCVDGSVQNASVMAIYALNDAFGIESNNCSITGTAVDGGVVGIFDTGGENTIANDSVYGATIDIKLMSSNNNVMNNSVTGATGDGILVTAGSNNNTVRNNTASSNGSNGIEVQGNGSTIADNTASGNTVNGIHVSGGHGNRIDNNHVDSSGAAGIVVDAVASHANFVMRNTSDYNIGVPYSLGAGNEWGPGTTMSAATNPWSNIND